jgi:hypothetical protein
MGLGVSHIFGWTPGVRGQMPNPLPRGEESGGVVGYTALSLGERVSGDGVFISRRRTGEGLLHFARRVGWFGIGLRPSD